MIKRLFFNITRSINPSLGHIDSCCVVGEALFVFGWRNPLTGQGIQPRVVLSGTNEKITHAFRLDFDRADVSAMFQRPVSDQLGSCWVFNLRANELASESDKETSHYLLSLYVHKLNIRAQEIEVPLAENTQSGLFSSLSQEQRRSCALASKGEFLGLANRQGWAVRPITAADDDNNVGLAHVVQDAVSWQGTLYLRISLPKTVSIERACYGEQECTVDAVYCLPKVSLSSNEFIVVIKSEAVIDGPLTMHVTEGLRYEGMLKCMPSSHLSSVLKLLLGPLDFRTKKTTDWLDNSTFSDLISALAPTLPTKEDIRVERVSPSLSNNATPVCSVIIPVYGRLDLIRYQIHAFSAFPNSQEVEFVFFLDDPGMEAEFFSEIRYLSKLFPLSITAVYAGQNFGFGLANNIAANVAKADTLLLLNSDVFPMSPGWVDRLLDVFLSKPDVGVLGAKLLFENSMIQHIGMSSKKDAEFPGIVLNDHPHKGMPESLVNLNPVDECKLITGACMMLDRRMFLELEGFDSHYLIGDFEDSDLCQRLLARGKRNYILNDIELIHVERQSQSVGMTEQWKQNLTLFNGWLYTRKWFKGLERGL